MQKPIFANDQIYHVYNRGVEKRQVFMDDFDRFRFIHDLFEFNDTAPAGKFSEVKPPAVSINKKRDLLVEIVCFCLMPNHFHLILRQLKDAGISNFMKKIGTGYTMHFNQKYERVGSLFQGSYKAILVENDEYLTHLSRYIHLNPVEIIEPEWYEKGIKQHSKVKKFLSTYRWSSYLDYALKNNFSSVINKSLIESYFQGSKKYQQFVESYLIDDYYKIQDVILD